MSDLVLTPEEMVAELQYRSEIIKELVETNGGLREENEKLREALKALAEHCNNMEAQNQDYHTMSEGGIPCLSKQLANAYRIIRESGDE